MTVAQLEDRLIALEQAVARLEERVAQPASRNGTAAGLTEDDIIDGVEIDFVPHVPPKQIMKLEARIVAIRRPPAQLALSDAEWESIAAMLEDDIDAQ